MEITNSMVRAAVNKAVEAGLLPRNGAQNEYDWEVMRSILAAALQTRQAEREKHPVKYADIASFAVGPKAL